MKEYDFKTVEKEYRPIPFWSWNDRLHTEESKRQIRLMHIAGMGGFFMHARGGLQTEYMGDGWFENIEASVDAAQALGMDAWAYDENGWPSGFADGRVAELGEEYCQKSLLIDESGLDVENTVFRKGSVSFYYEVNPFYIDNLDKKVVAEFIKNAYQPYYERYGNRIKGFFTDEPQIARGGIPWSACIPKEYAREYGEDLLPRLIHLFKDEGDYKNTRIKFWRLVTKLFSESYLKQIYDWCCERGLKLTGHLMCEDTLGEQLPSNGACMPHYRYFHIPGIDWLGRGVGNPLAPLQVSSVAAQYGKKQIISESFALCGHSASFSDFRKIIEYQMVRGVNLLCQHLEGYSMRGIRKRDYPPAMGYQQPWWSEYEAFVTAIARIGKLIAEGEDDCKTLLIHPEVTAWGLFCARDGGEISRLDAEFKKIISELEAKHISFHLGDEIILQEAAYVEDGRLVVGEKKYERVIVPRGLSLLDNTKTLLSSLSENGGKVIFPEDAEGGGVCDNPNITYLKRRFDSFDLHYFVNSTDEKQRVKLNFGGKRLDIITGELLDFSGDGEILPCESLVIIDYRDNTVGAKAESQVLAPLSLSGKWRIKAHTPNALTLDFCDCYLDGELVGRNIPTTSVQLIACDRGEPINLRCVFYAEVSELPDNLSLVCETPEIFDFKINGRGISFADSGYFIDKSFRTCDISEYVKLGKNEIELSCRFEQSKETYENIKNAKLFRNLRNKLTYDMEIESVYLIGDFSVSTDGEFEMLERFAERYRTPAKISGRALEISLENIEKQGFLNFAGEIVVEKRFTLEDTAKKLAFDMKGINAVKLRVNGKDAGVSIWKNGEIDISKFLVIGENTVELTMINNLRNLLGPHHLAEGESYFVGPFSFFKEPSFWSWSGRGEKWDDGWCITEISLVSCDK